MIFQVYKIAWMCVVDPFHKSYTYVNPEIASSEVLFALHVHMYKTEFWHNNLCYNYTQTEPIQLKKLSQSFESNP